MCERMGLARYANSGKLVELEHELPEDLALEPTKKCVRTNAFAPTSRFRGDRSVSLLPWPPGRVHCCPCTISPLKEGPSQRPGQSTSELHSFVRVSFRERGRRKTGLTHFHG